MAPAYLTALSLGLVAAARGASPPRRPGTSRVRRVTAWVAASVVALLAVGPPWLFPVFRLPAPGGPHAVGTTSFALTDSSRAESLGPDRGGRRSIMIRAWYPAPAGSSGQLAPYADSRELTGGIIGLLRLGPVIGGNVRHVRTHSIVDAPLASAPDGLPVLVFSHGYTGYSAQNTPQVEDLASRGYVVFGINHTHDAGATVFPGGRVVRLDPAIIEMIGGYQGAVDSVNLLLGKLREASTPEARQAAFKAFASGNQPRILASVPVWSADTRFLLDHLERLDRSSPGGRFAGALDLDRIGIVGMSFGGSNSGEVCRVDRRCKAGVNMDGQQFGPLIDDSLTVPFMIMASSSALPLHRPILDRLRGPGYLVHLRGSEHIGLTDTPLMAPRLLRWLGVSGTMAPARLEALMTLYLGAFFDQYLRGLPAATLKEPAPPDVEFEARNTNEE
jgi:predicted dienelactone hydrolase